MSEVQAGISTAPPDEALANLCNYYLNCISLEENNGVSTLTASKDALDYVELSRFPVNGFDANEDNNVATLIRKASTGRNLIAHVGYPVLIRKSHSRKSKEESWEVAPVFLFAVELFAGSARVSPIPQLNMEMVKQFSSRDKNELALNLIKIEDSLGLNSTEEEINLKSLVDRLQEEYVWGYREKIDPDIPSAAPPVSEITEEGIYNKATFIVSERAPYTNGLESELAQLAQLDEKSYQGTALYNWVHHNISENSSSELDDTPLLEVLPMNSEQDQAIRQALRNKLTIVTGPPGTGKSQVVTNLIINAVWNGKSILFTSRNNKAVDVVETRVNALGNRPIMLRLGSNQYAYHLAELIQALLSSYPDQEDRDEYRYYQTLYQDKLAEYQSIKAKKETIVKLRNQADHTEQKICSLRERFGKWFHTISKKEAVECERALKEYCSAYEVYCQARSSFWGKLFWFAIGKSKSAELDRCLSVLNDWFQKYKYNAATESIVTLNAEAHERICAHGKELVDALRAISVYQASLAELMDAPQLEDIDRELITVQSELSDIAKSLWKSWLAAQSTQIDPKCRKEMYEYVATMKLVGNADISEYPYLQSSFRSLQEKMTTYLKCQAVTSLSVRGRVTFRPGIVDLVIIDEASQCDIASALPVLYRAKHAVIIGDPQQLGHICTLSNAQDTSLVNKYKVERIWAYSTNSLYARADSLVIPEQKVHLRDHHRSFGDIIEFSNAEFYNRTLRVATNYDRLNVPKGISAGVHWVNKVGKTVRPSSGGAYNNSEVSAVVAELQRLVLDNGYTGSIGVVTPFKAQADHIRRAVAKNTALMSALSRNDFLVDTAHKFQGDERDVMFFSPVISQGTGQGALNFLKNEGNLFNVAITRARAVLIVVGDSTYCLNCGVHYMQEFAAYVMQKESHQTFGTHPLDAYPDERLYPKVSNPEQVSDWERLFYTALFDQGIRTIPQYPADKYKLDLAILDGDRMLDIEVDGELYHKDWNGEVSYRDQLRNQRLFELGWDVKRFWVYQIRDDLQSCIDQVREWCNSK